MATEAADVDRQGSDEGLGQRRLPGDTGIGTAAVSECSLNDFIVENGYGCVSRTAGDVGAWRDKSRQDIDRIR